VPAQGDFLFFVGMQPIIVFWGFEDTAGHTADPAATVVPAAKVADRSMGGPVTPHPLPAKGVAMRVSSRLHWWWLLALLVLLASLAGLRSCGLSMAPLVPSETPTASRAAGPALEIPAGALERGDLSFLEGQWQLGDNRLDEYQGGPDHVVGSGRNVLDFRRDGSGRGQFLERRRHAKGASGGTPYPSCSGGLKASTDGRVLVIVQDACIVTGGQGEGVGGGRAECRRTERGTTLCESVNVSDKHRWRAELRRLAPAR
jgi:hypothetical protein